MEEAAEEVRQRVRKVANMEKKKHLGLFVMVNVSVI